MSGSKSVRELLVTFSSNSGGHIYSECTVPVAETNPRNVAKLALESVLGRTWVGVIGLGKDEIDRVEVPMPDAAAPSGHTYHGFDRRELAL